MRTARQTVGATLVLVAACARAPQPERPSPSPVATQSEGYVQSAVESDADEVVGSSTRREFLPPRASRHCRVSGYTVDTWDGRAVVVQRVKPQYPREAAERGISGDVEVVVCIDKAGAVVSACRTSGPEALWESSEAAASKWSFSPRGWGAGCFQRIIRFSFHGQGSTEAPRGRTKR
jgi:TonB family protein